MTNKRGRPASVGSQKWMELNGVYAKPPAGIAKKKAVKNTKKNKTTIKKIGSSSQSSQSNSKRKREETESDYEPSESDSEFDLEENKVLKIKLV